jgi:hypothetical protein
MFDFQAPVYAEVLRLGFATAALRRNCAAPKRGPAQPYIDDEKYDLCDPFQPILRSSATAADPQSVRPIATALIILAHVGS